MNPETIRNKPRKKTKTYAADRADPPAEYVMIAMPEAITTVAGTINMISFHKPFTRKRYPLMAGSPGSMPTA